MRVYFHPDGLVTAEPRALGPKYTLMAVVSHICDTLNGGHFTADVRWPPSGSDILRRKWYHCDDRQVTDISLPLIQASTLGYMLFYVRRDTQSPVSSAFMYTSSLCR